MREACELKDDVCIAELNANVLEDLFEATRSYSQLPKFPAVSRDLNFVLSEAVTWAELAATVSGGDSQLLQDVVFSGQYRGKGIEAGKKSYLVTCRFLAEDRTLTTEEVDTAVQKILTVCEEKLEAKLR